MDIRDITFLRKIKYYPQKKKWEKMDSEMEAEAQKRRNGQIEEKYKSLLRYKDFFKGERCFIVANGPSLLLEDLEIIKNEYCFGMNSIIKLFDDTTWRPTFYGIQDWGVYEKMKDYIEASDLKNIFVSDELAEAFNVPKTYIRFPLNRYYHLYETQCGKYFSKFSNNAYAIVYDGFSITYSLIQLAIYMGFKKIYLLGTDCNYVKGAKNHVVESGHIDRRDYLNYPKMISGYKEVKKYIADKDIIVVNCTRGGKLEVFPRRPLKTVLFDD